MDVSNHPAGFSMERLGTETRAARRTLICAACGQQTDTVPCSTCGRNPLLNGRYRLERLLPRTTAGTVYSASDLRRAGRPVNVTLTPIRPELVDEVRVMHPRWMRALRRVDSPHVEPWSDSFVVGAGRSRSLAVVRAPDETPDLAASLGRPMALHQVLHIARSLLSALDALHDLSPAVSSGPLDRARVGVDAAGVVRIFEVGDLERFSDEVRPLAGEPPELRASMWSPASDVHRVAALVVCLLSGRSAAQMTDPRGGWDWERHTDLQPHLADLFSRWLARDPDLRPQSAALALRELDAATHLPTPPLPDQPSLDSSLHAAPAPVRAHLPRLATPHAVAPRLTTPAALPAAGLAAHASQGPMEPHPTPPRAAPTGRRKAPATQRIARNVPPPEQRSDFTRGLTAAVVVILVVATVTALQAALTASGTIPGTPWIGMNTPEEGAP